MPTYGTRSIKPGFPTNTAQQVFTSVVASRPSAHSNVKVRPNSARAQLPASSWPALEIPGPQYRRRSRSPKEYNRADIPNDGSLASGHGAERSRPRPGFAASSGVRDRDPLRAFRNHEPRNPCGSKYEQNKDPGECSRGLQTERPRLSFRSCRNETYARQRAKSRSREVQSQRRPDLTDSAKAATPSAILRLSNESQSTTRVLVLWQPIPDPARRSNQCLKRRNTHAEWHHQHPWSRIRARWES